MRFYLEENIKGGVRKKVRSSWGEVEGILQSDRESGTPREKERIYHGL